MRRYPQFTTVPRRVTPFDSEGDIPETLEWRRYPQFTTVPARVGQWRSYGSPSAGGGAFQSAWTNGSNVVLQVIG